MTGRGAQTIAALAVSGLLCCGAGGAVTPAGGNKAPQKPQAWSVKDHSELAELAPASAVATYQIRPPLEYVAQTQSGPAGATATSWVGPERPDHTRPYLALLLLTPPPDQAKTLTPAEVLSRLLQAVGRHYTGWKRTAIESGTVNGWPFVRAYWQGTAAGGAKTRGFSYVARDGATFVQISSQDVEPYAASALALAETSALTFRRS